MEMILQSMWTWKWSKLSLRKEYVWPSYLLRPFIGHNIWIIAYFPNSNKKYQGFPTLFFEFRCSQLKIDYTSQILCNHQLLGLLIKEQTQEVSFKQNDILKKWKFYELAWRNHSWSTASDKTMERDENLIEKVNKEVEKYIKIMKTDIEVTSEKLKPVWDQNQKNTLIPCWGCKIESEKREVDDEKRRK